MVDLLRLHGQAPVRRDVPAQVRYALYRVDLRADFTASCGYCGDDDERADKSTFHIDHFAPKKVFPHLELAYSNLVYACRFCNVSKSDHWIGTDPTIHNDGLKGFVDPCSEDYDTHLGREAGGRIIAKSDLGAYIVKRLKLYLLRHELLWRARKARALRDQIDDVIKEYKARGKPLPDYAPLLEHFYEITKSIDEYELHAAA